MSLFRRKNSEEPQMSRYPLQRWRARAATVMEGTKILRIDPAGELSTLVVAAPRRVIEVTFSDQNTAMSHVGESAWQRAVFAADSAAARAWILVQFRGPWFPTAWAEGTYENL